MWSLLKKLIWLRRLGGGGGETGTLTTVTGNPPLTLANALGKKLLSLVQEGLVSQAATPTPSSPSPLVCNNGTLAMVDDELPSEYGRIKGITFDSSVYYQITDFFLKGSDTIRISFSVEKACNVFGCYTTTSATNNYSLYASTAANAKYLRYAGGTYKSQFATSTFGQRFDVVITPTGSSGMPSGQNDTWSEADFTATSELCIAHTSPSGTTPKLDGNIWGNIVVDGRLKLIPCIRISDSEIGYYDTYTDTFYAPVTGTPVSLGYDTSHLTLNVVGTPEVISVGGKNLFNPDGITDGYISMNGNKIGNASWQASDFIPVLPSTQYYFNPNTTSGSAAKHAYYAADQTFIDYIASGAGSFTTPADCAFMRFSIRNESTDIQLEYGSAATVYEPYKGEPKTVASAENLFAVGTYADTQDIISGEVARNVGIVVFDGTETGWALSDSGTIHRFRGVKPTDCYTPASRAAIASTHFIYASAGQTLGGAFIGASTYWYFIPTDQTIDTAEKWKDWLAAEYAAGRPVVVLYPLKESTTESVTPQHIPLENGDNVISVTAEVDGINLTAQYMAKE